MKKILIGALVFLASAATVTAGDMTLGVKGTLAVETNSLRSSNAPSDKSPLAVVGGGGSVFFRYDFGNADVGNGNTLSFGIQPEIGFHAGWGGLFKSTQTYLGTTSSSETKYTANTIDIPVLLSASMNIKKFKVSVAAGPNFAFTAGKLKKTDINSGGTTTTTTITEHSFSPFLIGMQAGIGLGFNFNEHHGLILDIRGLFDFNQLGVDFPATLGNAAFTSYNAPRAAALFSLGYAYTF